jgi:nuclear transport factor 2 (NTF2) superfamily protein
MAAIALSATINIETEMTCRLTKLEYIWTTESDIQRFLNDESVIDIGDTYTSADAQYMENGVVREIVAYLSSFYEIDEDSNVPLLKELTAMLTAARIALAFSSAISNDPLSFAYRYQNEVWASLQQRAVKQDLSELTVVTVPLWQRLVYSKRREQTVRQEVR